MRKSSDFKDGWWVPLQLLLVTRGSHGSQGKLRRRLTPANAVLESYSRWTAKSSKSAQCEFQASLGYLETLTSKKLT